VSSFSFSSENLAKSTSDKAKWRELAWLPCEGKYALNNSFIFSSEIWKISCRILRHLTHIHKIKIDIIAYIFHIFHIDNPMSRMSKPKANNFKDSVNWQHAMNSPHAASQI
jgi:hypothetical protein